MLIEHINSPGKRPRVLHPIHGDMEPGPSNLSYPKRKLWRRSGLHRLILNILGPVSRPRSRKDMRVNQYYPKFRSPPYPSVLLKGNLRGCRSLFRHEELKANYQARTMHNSDQDKWSHSRVSCRISNSIQWLNSKRIRIDKWRLSFRKDGQNEPFYTEKTFPMKERSIQQVYDHTSSEANSKSDIDLQSRLSRRKRERYQTKT